MDVAITDADSGATSSIRILNGNGDGTFRLGSVHSVAPAGVSLVAADFNGDGALDLAEGHFNVNGLTVLLNNGSGSFGPPVVYGTAQPAFYPVAADFNGDGTIDVLSESSNSGSALTVLPGSGDGTFGPAVSSGSGAKSFAVADFNGDGVSDVVAATSAANTVQVFLGSSHLVTTIAPLNLRSQSGAREALDTTGQTIERIDRALGEVGSQQARLETAANNLRVLVQNQEEAASRITDADAAEESASLVKDRILQQAGAAVLAQANQLPTLALTLLSPPAIKSSTGRT